MADSLWGEEFTIKESPKVTKKIVEKINKPKEMKQVTQKVVKSTKIDIDSKLKLIKDEVYRILGRYKDDTILITTKEDLHNYIDVAIKNGEIAIDTETNNSLEPITCKLMGGCIYTPNMKNAYIPVNHINRETKQLLENQLSESDIAEEFKRLSNTKIIMHNGKFDYEVIKCTCGVTLDVYWDTELAARILDENEFAKLKYQYRTHIDTSQEKYDIEHLFEGLEYAIIDPELFALYAATDSYITYKLYQWQQEQFKLPSNSGLYNVFMNVEMPVVQVAAEMELTGVCIDKDYASRLSVKYHKFEDDIDAKISKQLEEYKQLIADWRLTPEANEHPVKAVKNKKTGLMEDKVQKSKSEQLKDPPEVTSPTQLAILLYDIFKVGVIDNKTPRGTGEEILLKIDNPLCSLILEKRGLEKLLSTYIDKLPECVCEKDGRLHAHFNQIGAGTGRFSSSDPNLQNIPSHMKNIRLMFVAGYTEREVESVNNVYELSLFEDVYTTSGWVKSTDVCVGDVLLTDEGEETISNIQSEGNSIFLSC